MGIHWGLIGLLVLAPGLVALAVAVLGLLAWVLGRRLRRRAAGDDLLGLYGRLQRRLHRYRAPPETPLEYQQSPLVGRWRRAPEGLLEEVTQAVNEGAYAGRWPEPSKVRQLAERIS